MSLAASKALSTAFMDNAPCKGVSPEIFYPEESTRTRAAAAKAICGVCPVRAECLDYALKKQEQFGVWGGLLTRERNRILAANLEVLPSHCDKGHALANENIYRYRGKYGCRKCARDERKQRYKEQARRRYLSRKRLGVTVGQD